MIEGSGQEVPKTVSIGQEKSKLDEHRETTDNHALKDVLKNAVNYFLRRSKKNEDKNLQDTTANTSTLDKNGQMRRDIVKAGIGVAGGVALDAATGGHVIGSLLKSDGESETGQVSQMEEVPTALIVDETSNPSTDSAGFSSESPGPPEIPAALHEVPPVVSIKADGNETTFLQPEQPDIKEEAKPEEIEKPKEVSVQKPEPSKPVEEKGIVALESFVDPEELERSQGVREIITEFFDKFTFKAMIDGKAFSVPLPFAEVGEGYGFPVTTYPDGSIPSKMTPEAAQERFQKAVVSGEFSDVYHKMLEKYQSIDPKSLTPNEKLAYNNLGGDQQFTSGEKYAFYNALREMGIYGDCNGTVYNALAYVYDTREGKRGAFDDLTRKTFLDLQKMPHPVDGFNIGRFGDDRWGEVLDPPPVKDLRAGDVIALGKEQHSMLVVGWDAEKRAIWLLQNTDETGGTQGVHMIAVDILDSNTRIEQQKWEKVTLAQDTTTGLRGGDRYQSRLDEPIGGSGKPYKVMRNREWSKALD